MTRSAVAVIALLAFCVALITHPIGAVWVFVAYVVWTCARIAVERSVTRRRLEQSGWIIARSPEDVPEDAFVQESESVTL